MGLPIEGKRKLAWDGFKRIVELADKAQIPIGGGAVGVLKELLGDYDAVQVNKVSLVELFKDIQMYSEAIWEFVKAMSSEYVKNSGDVAASFAREAIADFGKSIDAVNLLRLKLTNKSHTRRFVARSGVADEIAGCRKRLQEAYRKFNDTRMNVIVAGIHNLAVASSLAHDDLHLPGAKLLDYVDFELRRNLTIMRRASFWGNLSEAKVENEVRMVKMYHKRSGGKQRFRQDIEFLRQNVAPYMPKVYGYSDKASIPYLVFRTGLSNGSLANHLIRLGLYLPPEKAIPEAIKLMVQSADAALFLFQNRSVTYSTVYENMLSQSTVDSTTGQITISLPNWSDEDVHLTDTKSLRDLMSMLSGLWYGDMIMPSRILPVFYRLQPHVGHILRSEKRDDIVSLITSSDFKSIPDIVGRRWDINPPLSTIWPSLCEHGGKLQLGDVGVWNTDLARRVPVFDKLGNVAMDMGLVPLGGTVAPRGFYGLQSEQYEPRPQRLRLTWQTPEDPPPEGSWRKTNVFWNIEFTANEYFKSSALELERRFGVYAEELVIVSGIYWEAYCDDGWWEGMSRGTPSLLRLEDFDDFLTCHDYHPLDLQNDIPSQHAEVSDIREVRLILKGRPEQFSQLNLWRHKQLSEAIFDPQVDDPHIPGAWPTAVARL